MKISLKGFVHAVSHPLTKTSGNTSFRVQNLVLKVPGYRNQFDEQVGKDEFWNFELFNDTIDKQKLTDAALIGKKAEVTGYLNSRTFKKDGSEQYALQLRLAEYKVLA